MLPIHSHQTTNQNLGEWLQQVMVKAHWAADIRRLTWDHVRLCVTILSTDDSPGQAEGTQSLSLTHILSDLGHFVDALGCILPAKCS